MIASITQCVELLDSMGKDVEQWATQMQKIGKLAKECKVLNTKSEASGDWNDALKKAMDFVTDPDNVGAFKYFAIMGANIWLPHVHLATLHFTLTNLATVKRKLSEYARAGLKE